MKFLLLGRTRALFETFDLLSKNGHRPAGIITCKAAAYYDVTERDFEMLAEQHGIPFLNASALNTSEVLSIVSGLGAEVAVSVNWPTKVSREFRDQFRLGVLNAHAGDLPRYRGNATPNWAILNGEHRMGLCIHFMDDDLDSGDIVAREYMELNEETYIGDVYAWIGEACPKLFLDALSGLETGAIVPTPQDPSPNASLRCYPRTEEDGQIDWGQTAETIYRLVRASSRPFAGAYSFLDGIKVTIWRASIHRSPPFCAVPGQICARFNNRPLVACADEMLQIEEAEIEGDIAGDIALEELGKSLRRRLTSK